MNRYSILALFSVFVILVSFFLGFEPISRMVGMGIVFYAGYKLEIIEIPLFVSGITGLILAFVCKDFTPWAYPEPPFIGGKGSWALWFALLLISIFALVWGICEAFKNEQVRVETTD